jgi:hypothetical protein
MAVVTTVWRGVMYFQYDEQGWSEAFWFDSDTYNVALIALEALFVERLSTLPNQATGIYARVAAAGRPRDKHAHDGPYPAVAGMPVLTPIISLFCNDVENAQRVGLETADGRWATYHLRCLPDDQVENRKLVTDLEIVTPGSPIVPATTWSARLANYIESVRKATRHCREIAPTAATPPVRQFEVTPWARALDRKLAKKNTGRPFGLSRGRATVR